MKKNSTPKWQLMYEGPANIGHYFVEVILFETFCNPQSLHCKLIGYEHQNYLWYKEVNGDGLEQGYHEVDEMGKCQLIGKRKFLDENWYGNWVGMVNNCCEETERIINTSGFEKNI